MHSTISHWIFSLSREGSKGQREGHERDDNNNNDNNKQKYQGLIKKKKKQIEVMETRNKKEIKLNNHTSLKIRIVYSPVHEATGCWFPGVGSSRRSTEARIYHGDPGGRR